MALLIIDDDTVFCTVLARALRRRGFDVAVAHCADGAMAQAATVVPDQVVLDMKLGERSGLSLIEPLLALNGAMRIVVLTGYASIATAVEATKRGATNYLAKPVDADAVVWAFQDRQDRQDRPLPDQGLDDEPAAGMSLRRLEWEQIQRVLAEHDGNISAAARALSMHRRTLQRKLGKRPARH